MFKFMFLYLLFIHILGDYYFQTGKLAEEKNHSSAQLLKHMGIYFFVGVICIMPLFNFLMLIAVIGLTISHNLIDYTKYRYLKNLNTCPPEQVRTIYLLDQFLHITCIFLIAFALAASNIEFMLQPLILAFFEITEFPFDTLFRWCLVLLFIWKPANITIKKLLCSSRPSEEAGTKAGGFIGLLERLIILLFLSVGQYAAIGLVLTAKSIARYDEIAKNKDFAEYYLLGTLLSTFLVIAAYLLIF